MMEPEEVGAILLVTTLLAEKKKRKRRRLWVHPIIRDRQTGAFGQMFPKLIEHSEKFYNYFRMSPSSYEELHSLIEEKIRKSDTKLRDAIPSKERLGITLR
jgi:hypothetical protein